MGTHSSARQIERYRTKYSSTLYERLDQSAPLHSWQSQQIL